MQITSTMFAVAKSAKSFLKDCVLCKKAVALVLPGMNQQRKRKANYFESVAGNALYATLHSLNQFLDYHTQ